MSPSTRLLLIRHPQPRADMRDRCHGNLDIELSARGLRQARHIARTLTGVAVDAVYTSPLRRAMASAKLLAEPRSLEPIVLDDLREIDFGELEGLSFDEISSRNPRLYQQWMSAPTTVRFPGGESYSQLRRRALRAAREIRGLNQGGTAAVVAHAGVIRAILADVLKMPSDAIFQLDQSYGAISIVDWLDGSALVRLVNGQPTMVARRRRGYLPSFATSAPGSTPEPW